MIFGAFILGGGLGTGGIMPAELFLVKAQFSIGVLLLELLNLYTLIIIARVIISWINLNPSNPIVQFIRTVTDPLLIPIQNVIPPIGGTIDISPLIALVFIQMLKSVIVRVFW